MISLDQTQTKDVTQSSNKICDKRNLIYRCIIDTRVTYWKDSCTFISYLRKCDTHNRQIQAYPIAVHSRSFTCAQHACCEEERNAILTRTRLFNRIVVIEYIIGNVIAILTDCRTFWIANHKACRDPYDSA